MARELPEAIRRYLARTGEVRNETSRVLVEQRGTMRLKPTGKWLSFSAKQWSAVRRTEFCWQARIQMAPFVSAAVEDAYEDGRGRLEVKMWGAIPLSRSEGPELDRGEAQRYLAELPWNPGALRHNAALRFSERPDGAVRVWCIEPSIYVDLFFDEEGDVVRTFCDNRPLDGQGRKPWEGRFSEYIDCGGLRIPRKGEVVWLLPEGEFAYWRGEVTSLRQDGA